MPNKMLIDATHPEETRVVVLRGNRVEEFDFESANRKQLRGNIYLAKVTRVEPSLQAAFVDYGGNRHGFLAFSEIHPDYYQIPVADRQALIAEEEREQRAADVEADHRARPPPGRPPRAPGTPSARRGQDRARRSARGRSRHHGGRRRARAAGSRIATIPTHAEHDDAARRRKKPRTSLKAAAPEPSAHAEPTEAPIADGRRRHRDRPAGAGREQRVDSDHRRNRAHGPRRHRLAAIRSDGGARSPARASRPFRPTTPPRSKASEPHGAAENGHNITEVNGHGAEGEEEVIESVGGADAMEEVPERTYRSRRQYKIQEVIKRRQVMLVQVVKEERGTKGAALTTYLSLAGRYSVLMPNTARGGGISRKITAAEDRRKLKEIAQELEVPEGMGVILRTAGAARTKTEVKRDFEYLLRLWETVRDLTLRSTAPMLVYEEGSLVKRSIRDLYNKDIDEIIVAGEDSYKDAKDFMRMLMPSHAGNVKRYTDTLPIFTRYGIESQLDAMFQPVMQLRSGGYIVINQTEALVAIDVNSGRATREHHIEDTALKTNMEAAEEIARQLRLRDLAGLIVIDFIDMDEKRNNRAVERKLKECLRHDRARIQVGHISHFGLLEMSRQRIRSSVLESSTEKCAHCGGTGHMRSVSSVALQLLRVDRRDAAQGRDAQSRGAHAHRDRALPAQPEARPSALAGGTLPDRHPGQRRSHHRRAGVVRDREGRAGAQPRAGAGAGVAGSRGRVEVEEEEDVVLEDAEAEEARPEQDEEPKDDEPADRSPKARSPRLTPRNGPRARTATAASAAAARTRGGERRDEGAQAAHEPSAEHPIAPSGDDEESPAGAEAECRRAGRGGRERQRDERRRRTPPTAARPPRRTAQSSRPRRRSRRRHRERPRRRRRAGDRDGFGANPRWRSAAVADASAGACTPQSPHRTSLRPSIAQSRRRPLPLLPKRREAPAPEAPRRRSTVREPVPVAAFAGASIPAPLPPPAVAPPPP